VSSKASSRHCEAPAPAPALKRLPGNSTRAGEIPCYTSISGSGQRARYASDGRAPYPHRQALRYSVRAAWRSCLLDGGGPQALHAQCQYGRGRRRTCRRGI